jgi:zinc protease
LKFFDRFYRPENCVVLVVGDVDPEKFFSLAEKYYSNWKRGNYVLQIPAEQPQKEERSVVVDWKGPTLPYLMLSYHQPAFSTEAKDKVALDLLAKLAFSETSPLYEKLILDKQLADHMEVGGEDNRDASLFEIFLRVKDEKALTAARDEILAKIEELKTHPVSEKELADVKSNNRYSFAMRLTTPDRIAYTLANYLNLTGDPESINKVFDLYDQVTPADIQQAAQKYFTRENLTVVTLKGEAN